MNDDWNFYAMLNSHLDVHGYKQYGLRSTVVIFVHRNTVLSTPMKQSLFQKSSSAAQTEAKYESTHAMWLESNQGEMTLFTTWVPCKRLDSFCSSLFSSSPMRLITLTNFKRSTQPRPHAAFWILQPFSGLQSIATYCGRPWLIQWPPSPYQRLIDSSTQIVSDREKRFALWLLNFAKMKSSTNFHRCCSVLLFSARAEGCLLHLIARKRTSNWCFDIPVRPKLGAGQYFIGATELHWLALEVNSEDVICMRTPKNLRKSEVLVTISSNFASSSLVKSTIETSCFGGNMRRKKSIALMQFIAAEVAAPGIKFSLITFLTLQFRKVWEPFHGGSPVLDALCHLT